MQNVIIHCKPSLLQTIKDLELDYQDMYDEIDVTIPYTYDMLLGTSDCFVWMMFL